jgi:hypothetical protein
MIFNIIVGRGLTIILLDVTFTHFQWSIQKIKRWKMLIQIKYWLLLSFFITENRNKCQPLTINIYYFYYFIIFLITINLKC